LERPTKNEYLSGEASARSALSMLRVADEPPKVVEVSTDGAFDLDEKEEEPSLMDELYKDAEEARVVKETRKAKEATRMKKTFGTGLKKGFFDDDDSSTKKKKKKGDEKGPKLLIKKKEDKASVQSRITEEVQEKMREEVRLNEEKKKEWLNTDLLEEMAKRPRLARGFTNPKYAAAIEALQKDPDTYREMMWGDNDLRDFVNEFCEVMGSHFTGLADKQIKKDEESILRNELGPLAAKIHQAAKEGKVDPAKTDEEKKQVDDVLNNPELKALLTDPKTQDLMERCGDPDELTKAMADPHQRAILETLATNGLVQLV